MTSFPGRGPPASRPPGIDSDKCDMRALAKAGVEFLEGAICAPRIALVLFFPALISSRSIHLLRPLSSIHLAPTTPS